MILIVNNAIGMAFGCIRLVPHMEWAVSNGYQNLFSPVKSML